MRRGGSRKAREGERVEARSSSSSTARARERYILRGGSEAGLVVEKVGLQRTVSWLDPRTRLFDDETRL